MAFLAPCLDQLRDQFDELNPNRDKASDGWIGDLAHCPADGSGTSDHCPDAVGMVHAIDVDEDLRVLGVTLMSIVRTIVEDCRAGRETRLKYVIYERTIWSASWGWTAREYTGSNPHDKHGHFSAKTDTANENSRREWNLGVDMALTDADIPVIIRAVWSSNGRYDDNGTYSRGGFLWDMWNRTGIMYNQNIPTLLSAAAADATRYQAMMATLDTIKTLVAAGGGDVDVDAIKAHIDAKVSETNAQIEAMRAAMQAEIDFLQSEVETSRALLDNLPEQLSGELDGVTQEQVAVALEAVLPALRVTKPIE